MAYDPIAARRDLQTFINSQGWGDLTVVELALKFGLGYNSGRHLIKNMLAGTAKPNPRTLFKLWKATGSKFNSLKPVINPFQGWLFEHDMTDKEFADRFGIPLPCVHSYVYKGSTPGEAYRQILYEATGLEIFSGKVNPSSNHLGNSIGQSDEAVVTMGTPFSPLDNSLPEKGNDEAPRSKLTPVLEILQRLTLGPDSTDTPSALLEDVAASIDSIASIIRDKATLIRAESVDKPVEGELEHFVRILHELDTLIDWLKDVPPDVRSTLRKMFEPRLPLKVGTALASLLNETDFQGWRQSGRISI